MQTINNRMTETQIADLFSLAVQLQVKAEESDDRDTAILAYSIQNACSNLTESQREFRAADATIHNLELQLTEMAVQLANSESKCRELEAAENNLIDSECHVAELEESLRDKQALLEALDNSLCELLPGTQYMDPPDGGSVTPLEQVRRMVADYRERIEELESRELAVKQFDDFQIVHYGATEDYAKGYIDCQNNYNKVLSAAGIGVKGE